ncbi:MULTISPECIES: phosphopantetheine-binding protein [Pseudoalteromonas]|uniref:Acyl carrier protein n=1 Tax=Pseudoalteromonas ruthenica TaxID=151081 RepID=A0A0F4PMX4_9GAMM|nr:MULTISPECIES: phosphopantetheine-binding protein [Pseudoalteromonas]KJY95566.1 acyl carrier protein [Pseudoalteromonas ruthenica]KJZ00546.1 acyl carrier protein [Pseudoalteromonas ruthenica]MCF2860595.1 phosphopantetheine-binding protein [Pseudoalteromonas sp. CNAT2-18]MCG7544231.1 phosphopantetheine-binding protein [Pseudoalteromonas sp. MM17-2]MCG7556464.1 phosphopantetheine-binding protein [Pseudoalteromonas sp. CNAT2-18.1]|tara:strand:- start:1180 stop:1443 length:264 start_codon:yes stop_codon:yes gene_type:complete
MNELKLQLKQLIINSLDLEDVSVDDIDDSEPLFVDGLGLDSIDALELGLAIKKEFNVKIDANSEQTKAHFASINALAEFIEQSRNNA